MQHNHEYRKLQTIQRDLTEMQQVLQVPADNTQPRKQQQLDAFDRTKQTLTELLAELRTGVDRLQELRKERGDGAEKRDVVVIRLTHANDTKLAQADELLASLEQMQQKAERKKKATNGTKSADRREWLRLLRQEIQSLRTGNARHRLQHLTKGEEAMVERQKQRRERSKTRTRSRSSPPASAPIAIDHMIDISPQTEQEVAFERAVQDNISRENQRLDQISIGLDDLNDLARHANKQLAVQDEMLHKVDRGMDHTIAKFRAENRRLKDLLASSGGMVRCCPIVLCVIILLALLGYMLSIV
jgi:hypothetical protein